MDTKLDTLDPKLKEAYDRVMGTAMPQRPESQTPMMQTHVIPDQPLSQTPMTPTAAPSEPTASPSHMSGVVSSGFVAGGAQDESKPRISSKLLIFGAVAFFIVYTLICLMVFQVPIPFISG